MNFVLNQTVRGKVAGTFVIIGLRTIGGEQYAQLKEIDPASGRRMRGELCLPLSALIAA